MIGNAKDPEEMMFDMAKCPMTSREDFSIFGDARNLSYDLTNFQRRCNIMISRTIEVHPEGFAGSRVVQSYYR